LHSSFNHDKKSEGTAEIAMATKVPDSVDKHVGSRVRMRRLMLDMSQETLGNELGITFQQVQKYEKGTNRISASRLQAMSHILQVPVPFFFEGAPQIAGHIGKGAAAPSPDYVTDFLAHADGLKLVRAFTEISDAKLRRSLVRLVEQIVGEDGR
jgi:transcriptional regulator with XRE-family HTH domain